MTRLPASLQVIVRDLRRAVQGPEIDDLFLQTVETILGQLCALVRRSADIETAALRVLDSCRDLHEEAVTCAKTRRAPEHTLDFVREDVAWSIDTLREALHLCECSDFALMTGLGWTLRRDAA
jgi:hypothetical protein